MEQICLTVKLLHFWIWWWIVWVLVLTLDGNTDTDVGAIPLEPVPAVGWWPRGGTQWKGVEIIRQLNDLEKPNCFPAQGLLEKVINFLEGKGDRVIYCLNQDSFKSKSIGHWGHRPTLALSLVNWDMLPLSNSDRYCSPGLFNSTHCLSGTCPDVTEFWSLFMLNQVWLSSFLSTPFPAHMWLWHGECSLTDQLSLRCIWQQTHSSWKVRAVPFSLWHWWHLFRWQAQH